MKVWGRRAADPPAEPRATYARILDGETLWLAVSGSADVALGGRRLDLAPHGDLHTGRIPLTGPGELTADGSPLLAADGALERGPLTTPPTRDGRWQYAVVDDAGLRVTRSERPPEVTLRDARVDGDGLVVDLDVVTGTLMLLDGAGATVAEVPVVDGAARLTPEPEQSLLTLAVDGVPVRRRRNALRFPGAGVLLPGHDPYLRWLRDGRLALARPDGAEDEA